MTRGVEELASGEAVASEITNGGWRSRLGHTNLPRVTPEEAGENLGRLAGGAHLTYFAHYSTDHAGHRGGMAGAIRALERVDRFLDGVLRAVPEDTALRGGERSRQHRRGRRGAHPQSGSRLCARWRRSIDARWSQLHRGCGWSGASPNRGRTPRERSSVLRRAHLTDYRLTDSAILGPHRGREIRRVNETASATPKILGRLLIESASITDLALAAALEKQRQTGQRLGTTLVRMQHCGEEHVARALAKQLSLPYAAPPLRPEVDALPFVGEDLARRNAVVPLGLGPRTVRLAMADPLDLATVDDVRFRTGRRVEAVVASPSAVAEALELALGDDLKIFVDALPGEPVGVDGTDGGSVEAAASATPVVQLVERILEEAVSAGASDVHLERHGEEFRVRLRVDGVLRDVVELPTWSRGAVLSRVKILGGMDISVKRRPQDGGFVYHRMEKRYSVRVSTIPVDKGEKAVMRILDPGRAPADLDGVGLSTADLDVVRRLLGAGHGVILTAGPTGSGKSTTLFGALGEVDRRGQNVVTLEDPIEYRVAGVNQVQVRPRAGLTFPAALRAVLRQDPDVVMVGRDP